MNYRLVSALMRGKWAIDPHFAINNLTLVSKILDGSVDVEIDDKQEYLPFALDPKAGPYGKSTYNNWNDAPQDSVAVIRIRGTLMKDDQFCGPVGMETMGEWIRQADANNRFSAIVLQIDSPGGTVDGTETLANIVKGTKKPVVAFVDGLMASAALWIGSSADEIFASTDTDEIGSVGVLLSFADLQPAYEKMGVKFHTIVAEQSKDKIRMWEDLRAGKYDEYKKEFLNPLAEKFMNAIRENRPSVEEKHLTGKVFFAKNIMEIFIDQVGTLQDAVNRAYELSQQQKEEEEKNESKNNKMKKHNNISRILGTDLESVDNQYSLNEDQMEVIDNALGSNADNENESEQLREENERLTNELEQSNSRIAELEQQDAARAAAALKEKDEYIDPDRETNEDKYTHNQVADKYLETN